MAGCVAKVAATINAACKRKHLRACAMLTLLLLCVLCSAGVWAWKRHALAPGYRLAHGSAEERQWAVREIAKRGPDDAGYGLVCRALDDADPGVRLTAVAAIEHLRRPDAVARLLSGAGRDRPLGERLRTLEALADCGGDAAWQAVREALRSAEPEPRALAARLLGRHRVPGALGLLEPLLTDATESVRTAALEAIGAFMPSSSPRAAAASLAHADRVVWEAERATGIKANLDPGPSAYERARLSELAATDPYWVAVAGYSGEGWLECLEGGGGNHNWLGGESASIDIGEAHYPLLVPRTGSYRLWARMWFTDKCGDSYFARFDDGPKRLMDHPYVNAPRSEWRQWIWLADYLEPVHLEAGMHTLHIQVREDGIRIDQFCLLRDGATAPIGQAPLPVNYDPLAFAADGADIALYNGSLVISEDGVCSGAVWVMRLGTAPLAGTLEVVVPGGAVTAGGPDEAERKPAAEPGTPLRLPVDFAETGRVFAADFTLRFHKTVPCSEYVLTARFLPAGGGAPRAVRRILCKPWPWQIAGPLVEAQNLTALLGDRDVSWREFPASALYERFGTMDFLKPFGKDARSRVFLRSRLRCEVEGEYLWLLNSDDHAAVWLDGREALVNPRNKPAEGFLTRARIRLSVGEHVVVAAVWQSDLKSGDLFADSQNQWRFRLRVRQDDHEPASVAGVPWRDVPAGVCVPAGVQF